MNGMSITLIAAVGRRGQIGLNGRLPWHDTEDLRRFRERTSWGVVIMGRRTAAVVGELPNRVIRVWDGATEPEAFLRSIYDDETLPFWATGHGSRPPRVFIAGGAHTYRAFLPLCRHIDLTRIDYDGTADTWMPPLWVRP